MSPTLLCFQNQCERQILLLLAAQHNCVPVIRCYLPIVAIATFYLQIPFSGRKTKNHFVDLQLGGLTVWLINRLFTFDVFYRILKLLFDTLTLHLSGWESTLLSIKVYGVYPLMKPSPVIFWVLWLPTCTYFLFAEWNTIKIFSESKQKRLIRRIDIGNEFLSACLFIKNRKAPIFRTGLPWPSHCLKFNSI